MKIVSSAMRLFSRAEYLAPDVFGHDARRIVLNSKPFHVEYIAIRYLMGFTEEQQEWIKDFLEQYAIGRYEVTEFLVSFEKEHDALLFRVSFDGD